MNESIWIAPCSSAGIVARKAPPALIHIRPYAGRDARAPLSRPELRRALFDKRGMSFFEIGRLHAQGLRYRFSFQR